MAEHCSVTSLCQLDGARPAGGLTAASHLPSPPSAAAAWPLPSWSYSRPSSSLCRPPTLTLSPLSGPYCRGLPGPPRKHFCDLQPPLSSPPPPAPPSPSTITPLPWAPGPQACPSLVPVSLTPLISFPGLRAKTTSHWECRLRPPCPAPGPSTPALSRLAPSPPPTSAPDFPNPVGAPPPAHLGFLSCAHAPPPLWLRPAQA